MGLINMISQNFITLLQSVLDFILNLLSNPNPNPNPRAVVRVRVRVRLAPQGKYLTRVRARVIIRVSVRPAHQGKYLISLTWGAGLTLTLSLTLISLQKLNKLNELIH